MTRDVFGDDVWRKLREAFEAAVIDAPVTEDGYGTSMHYPHCPNRRCTGCVPGAPAVEWRERRPFDPSIFSAPPAVDRYARALREAEQHCHCDAAPSGYLTIREHSTMCPLYNF